MTNINSHRIGCALFVLCFGTMISASAQTFRSLLDFDSINGSQPEYVSLVQGIDGDFYGTTQAGGTNQVGTVFRITPKGTLTTLYSFCAQVNCTDGAAPLGGLVLGTDGNLYGTTSQGGAAGTCTIGCGTVFKITAAGKLTTLYTFCVQGINSCKDGWFPYAPLIQASDGSFYGTTTGGIGGPSGYGTVFRMSPYGKLTTLHRFSNIKPSGYSPYGPVLQASDGNLYGTTSKGGASGGSGSGTIFRITSTGAFSTIYSFNSTDGGVYPYSGLIQATDGKLYGTTSQGGANGSGTVYGVDTEGALTFQYSFCSRPHCADGDAPVAPVTQATDGNFYGTTLGSPGNHGTLFELTPQGTLTTLYVFCSQITCTDGASPYGGLLQATNGAFYGTTQLGGDLNCFTSGCGTIFSLSTGLGQFVSFVNNPAMAGQPFGILGQGLKGATSVTLNGSQATFTIVSETLIKATVPQDASTGYVTVTTPTGVLTSNVPFHVIP